MKRRIKFSKNYRQHNYSSIIVFDPTIPQKHLSTYSILTFNLESSMDCVYVIERYRWEYGISFYLVFSDAE